MYGLSEAFGRRGFATEVLPTTGTPLFYASRSYKGAKRTILFYMHFDGQPVDPAEWSQESPYKAVLKKKGDNGYSIVPWEVLKDNIDPELRIFGRSGSDDKGPIVMLLSAIDMAEKEKNGVKVNIKVILDGEEEKGSRQLPEAVEKYRDRFSADLLIVGDGPLHMSEKPTVVFGCRGNMRIDLTTFGPRSDQHSGHYGNYAPNPGFMLAELLASMKDEGGRVLIPGYYDGITFSPSDMAMMKKVPDDEVEIRKIIGIAEPEKVGSFYQESLQYPSLNVRGLESAETGNRARTIVPARAVAAIDVRLVPESDPIRLAGLIKQFMQQKGYYVIDRDPTEEERMSKSRIVRMDIGGITLPFRTDPGSEQALWLTSTLTRGLGEEPVLIRIMGGSVPVSPFITGLKIPAVIVPVVNNDNNQHAPNENLRMWNLINGIKTFLAIIGD